jgi:predicted dehydrogenase/NADPH:quinone reductase-like Zn-dependent oxidoreductase
MEVPEPFLLQPGLLVETVVSVISSGTERSKIEMGEKGLLAKARARPDLARKVIEQVRRDGIQATVELVRDRLGSPQPLGYSACGVVREVGVGAVGFEPGRLVAIAGAGYANHAEVNSVPGPLAASVPEGVRPEDAAFATLGSIALHGIRQADLTQGELVVVSGLGLIGQLTVRLLRAYGHPVVGVDPSPAAQGEVVALGVDVFQPDDDRLQRVQADAVLLTAATNADGPIRNAPEWCRDRGRVVVVGDVGLSLTRAPYYDNEVELRFSRSYGPGRYDPSYEELGRDYPIGYVRWTEGRNLHEVLRLLAEGLLKVDDLVDGRYAIADAPAAYERLARGERARALLLDYPEAVGQRTQEAPTVSAAAREESHERITLSVCGAGNFARKVLLPSFAATQCVDWAYVSTASGLTAAHIAQQRGFRGAAGSPREAILGDGVNAALIASRHDSHAELAGLAASREIPAYVEKPLAISHDELLELEAMPGSCRLTTGFNRRAALAVAAALPALRGRHEAGMVQMRVNAGRLPAGYWADTAQQGGRIVGEVCHFVDLACFLLGSPVSRVAAVGGGKRQPQVEDTLQVLLAHVDGSATTIAYVANGSRDLPKEHVEVHWESRSFVIQDFRSWQLDTGSGLKTTRSRKQDKGHATLVSSFVDFARGRADNPVPFRQAAHVTRVTLAIVEALAGGGWVAMGSTTW